MVEDAFQQVDELTTLEKRTMEIIEEAFVVADGLHEEVNARDGNNNEDEQVGNIAMEREPLGEETSNDAPCDNSFDPMDLENIITKLYKGSKCTKLVATILLMNLCIVHGVNNKFANELFTFLRLHLLLGDNCLLNNYYVAKTLTKRLILYYKNIHACSKGCILFQGTYKDCVHYAKCEAPCYKDESVKTPSNCF
jgi:hypothetical protein